MPGTLAQLLGTKALTIWERDGSRGALLAELAPAISQLKGYYHSLPDNTEALFTLLQGSSEHNSIQLAIGKRSEKGTPIALWDGKRGAAQTLQTWYPESRALPADYRLCRPGYAAPLSERPTLFGQYETIHRSEAITI